MERSLQLPTKLQKCCSMSNNVVPANADRICQLSDDILVNILSRLTMKEAARTTILSHRWQNLWTHTTGSLDLDGSKVLWAFQIQVEVAMANPKPARERPVFVSWVNQILKSHKGATINEFRVYFDLDSSSRSDIDNWINFALQKSVRRLELDLQRVTIRSDGVDKKWEDMYPFPVQSVIGHPTINALTYLRLNFVDVTQELLEYLLTNCPFLEYVCVRCSPSLVGAKVFASPKLRYLEISYCLGVEILEISSAINLRTLKFVGLEARLCFENAPNLTDVSFGGVYAKKIVHNFPGLSIPPSQIEKLKLDWALMHSPNLNAFPKLENLKHLELVLTGGQESDLPHYATLFEKCPMLYRLCVEFIWVHGIETVEYVEAKCTLQSLKLVEISGFRGCISDFDLADFLVTNAPYLEKMSIDTRLPTFFTGTPLEYLQKENVTAKALARQLSTKLSPSVEFLVL